MVQDTVAAAAARPATVAATPTAGAGADPSRRRWRTPGPRVAEALVDAWLEAHRDGTLAAWLARRPRLAACLRAQWLAPVLGTLGDAPGEGPQRADSDARALAAWLRWAIGTLRPDRGAPDAPVAREDWLSRTSWRPMLALRCHFGFEPVPVFRDRYRAAPDEAPASQLCGLWAIGASTYYRHVDKGREALAACLRSGPPQGAERLSLRAAVARWALPPDLAGDAARLAAWHRQQAVRAAQQGDAASALWHLVRAGRAAPDGDDPDVAMRAFLRSHLAELAAAPEAQAALAEAMDHGTPPARFEALLLRAELSQVQGRADAQRAWCEQALREAHAADDPVRLGRAASALGRYHEPRDADRAFALFEDATDALWRAGADQVAAEPGGRAPALVEAYAEALVRLGWLLGLRNDPRARLTLERVEALRARHTLTWATLALLEQAWGEYWRRAGEPPRALAHLHRAMNLHERAGDTQAQLKACCNLALVYGEIRDFPRAVEHSRRVLTLAATTPVEPQLLSSTQLNLGVALFWQGDTDGAAAAYGDALAVAEAAGLALNQGRAHYNLAEVAYQRFRLQGDPADEAAGDRHAAAALAVWPHGSDPAYAEATRALKDEVLSAPARAGEPTPAAATAGRSTGPAADRLAPQESLLHPVELARVAEQRSAMAAAMAPTDRAGAHLAIAQAYLTVAVKEREAALGLLRRHGLDASFDAALAALQATWSRELDREQATARRWAAQAADLLGEDRCRAVLAALQADGLLRKRRYAEAAGVSPATASKHLATLVSRGLLEQSGKGPATRYRLT